MSGSASLTRNVTFWHTVTREVTAIMNTGKSWFQFTVLLCLAILSIMLASCGDDDSEIVINTESLRIYEMIAGDGSFTAVPGDPGGDRFQLCLENVPEDIFYFTDRPARETDFDTMENVMKNIWPRVYGSVAPNAIIKATLPDQEIMDIFCILDSPVYSASASRLNFTITYLNGSGKPFSGLAVTDVKLIILNNATTADNEWSQLLTGDTGTFEPTGTEGIYTFRMGNVIGNVLSFTSAPGRQSLTLTAEDYVRNWLVRFGSTPPNGTISYDANDDQNGGIQVVTLSDPVYDDQTGGIRFTAKILYGFLPIGDGGLTVNSPSLFIDGGASDGLTVTVVNKSERTAYVKFTGESLSVTPNNVSIGGKGGSKTFSLVSAKAGRIYVSFDQALSSNEPDGANTGDGDFRTRFDKVELTYENGGGKANLTAVDFYAIPMMLETSIEGTTIEHLTLADNMTGTLIQSALTGVMTDSSSAVIKNEKGTETVRILSPVKRPGAYPGFDAHLQKLPGSELAISGIYYAKPARTYAYTGSISADSITLKEGTQHTIEIPMATLKWHKTDTQNANGIYTCNSPYTVDGDPSAVGNNDIYAAVYRDLMTAFNLGYVKPGKNDSADWWGHDATPFQGTFNTYAKEVADSYPGAYGFPFTDRYNHILADLGGKIDTMTITVLGDQETPPPYTPEGTLNPQSGVTTFNMVLQAPVGSGFKGTTFTFDTHAYTGGKNYDFPAKDIGGTESDVASQVNKVPAQNGLNIYKLEVLNKTYTVLVKVEGGKVVWGSITGGASATWSSPNLFVGV